MARKKWSDSARKKQSKIIKKMWADKKKTEDTREPWVIAQEKREADREAKVKALREVMTAEQMEAALAAAIVMQDFICDYQEEFEIYRASIPRDMVTAKAKLEKAFGMISGEGYQPPKYGTDGDDG
tara:strand:+ start:1974 stop:2351 length:378 start_codon:yes stop_codon:yes gene_type:complete